MCSLIGCGHWNRYYLYIIISIISKFLKEDILGLGVKYPLIKSLKIIHHPIMTLLIGYTSDFILSLILWLFYNYRERKIEQKKHSIITENETEELATQKTMDNMFELKDSSSKAMTFNSESSDSDELTKSPSIMSEKYSLIHNDVNEGYQDISKSSKRFLFISSGLIVTKEILNKILYSSNEVFDFYFLNLVIVAIILKRFYKKKIYKHHILAIIIVVAISGACIISCIIVLNDVNFKGDKAKFSITYSGKIHLIIILVLLYIIMSIGFCVGIIFQKNLMQLKFISSYKFLFYKGIFGVVLCIIGLSISTNIKCYNDYIIHRHDSDDFNQNEHFHPFPDSKPIFVPNARHSDLSYDNFTQPIQIFMCVDHYYNDTYFDNFYSYFNNENMTNITSVSNITINTFSTNNVVVEVFVLIGYFILNFISNISLILVNKFLSPFHYLITESFYSLIHIPYQYFTSEDTKELLKEIEEDIEKNIVKDYNMNKLDLLYYLYFIKEGPMILKFSAAFFEFIGYLIYLEIIQLNFCGLNRDLAKNIKKRAKLDSIMSEKELNEEENGDANDDSLELSRNHKK